jgi:hypothetical protein
LFYVNTSDIVATKVVTTTGLAEDTFNEGLVAVNLEAKEFKEPDHAMRDPLVTYDVISKNSPIPRDLIRVKGGQRELIRPV